MTAREEYAALIRQAQHYEGLARDDATGGPSHWNRARAEVVKAITTPYSPDDDGLTSGEMAIRQAFQSDLQACNLLWKKAGGILRTQAQTLKQRLVDEALLIEQQLAEIEKVST